MLYSIVVTRGISQLEKVLSRIKNHLEYDSAILSQSNECLRREALGHSLRLEGIGNNITSSFDLPKELRETFDFYMNALSQGREYLFKEGISTYSVSQLGRIVEPVHHPVGDFRKREVMFGGFEGTLPSQIHYTVDDIVYRANNIDSHPVLSALDSHISLVQVHPFLDGNGRSARLIQDVLLERDGYPVPVVKQSEREFYIRLMENVISERMGGHSSYDPGSGEKYFQEFMVGKVLNSALDIEKKVRKQRNVLVDLDTKNTPISKSIADMLRKRMKSQGKCARVNMSTSDNDGSSTSLQIVGDVSQSEVQKMLEKISEKKKIDFEIKR